MFVGFLLFVKVGGIRF